MTQLTFLPSPVTLSSLFDRVEALFQQAELALGKEQLERAEYFFQAAHSKDPENLDCVFNEAQTWHRYAKILSNQKCFQKGYKTYKQCFSSPQWQAIASSLAIELKLDEHESLNTIGSIYDALRLIESVEKKLPQEEHWKTLPFQKVQCLFYKAKHEKDIEQNYEALRELIALYNEEKKAKIASIIADVLLELHELTQEIAYCITAINYRKQAIDLDDKNIEYYKALALDHQKLYFITLDESQIQHFHELCEVALSLKPEEPSTNLLWAEGLIDMGIVAEKTDWVKLGIEKSQASLDTAGTNVDLLIARGLSFLGKSLDRLTHIQEAFEKIKAYDEDPSSIRLTTTYYDILTSLGSYFQDVDYFYQAIEKLQEALSLNNSHRIYWQKMARTYLDISHLDNNPQSAEMAIKMIDKALAFYRCPETLLLKSSILARLGELKQNSEFFEEALYHHEVALTLYPTLFQPTLSHLFTQAKTLDFYASFNDDEQAYHKALDLLTEIILNNPKFPDLHHQIALTQFHLGELTLNPEIIKKSLSHFKLASQDPENDSVYVDWAIACLTLSEMVESSHEVMFLQHETANKLKKALKHGQIQAYYFMACLCCLCNELDKAITFLKIAERHDILPNPDDLNNDEWLSPLKDHEEFIKLLERQEMRRL
jgi:tetratricopeptide (TPR) repeat protein